MNLPPLAGWTLFGWTLAALAAATLIGQILRRTTRSETGGRTVDNLNLRIAAWWVLCGTMGLALWLGEPAVLVLFAAFSGLALREFAGLLPGAGFQTLAAFIPFQYAAVWARRPAVFGLLIPAGGFLCVPLLRMAAGGTNRFLEDTAKAYWGILLSTWCVSHAPALMMLEIRGTPGAMRPSCSISSW